MEESGFKEEQFILRVPEAVAEQIRAQIQSNNFDLDLDIDADGKAKLRVEGTQHFGGLTTLPCYMETFKTFDDKNYYKSADVAEMVLIRDSREEESEVPEQWNSGLTPATRNIRQRRAARHPQIDPEDITEVEEQIKQIIDNHKGDELEVLYLPYDGDTSSEPSVRRGAPSPPAPRSGKHSPPPMQARHPPRSPSRSVVSRHSQMSAAVSGKSGWSGGSRRSASPSVTGKSDKDSVGDKDDSSSDDGMAAALEAELMQVSDQGGADDSDDSEDSVDDKANNPQIRELKAEYAALTAQIEQQNHEHASTSNAVMKSRISADIQRLEEKRTQKRSELEALGA